MYGIELESIWLITPRDTLTVGFSSMKGKYGKLFATTGFFDPVTRSMGVVPARDLTGTEMANMPRFNLQLAYDHVWDLGDYGILSASIDTYYKTEYYNTIETYVTGALVPDHHISNIYLNWSSASNTWSAGSFVKNVERKAIILRTMGGGREALLNNPRIYGLYITYRFQ
jgi:iron complex outermembrane receptor protein